MARVIRVSQQGLSQCPACQAHIKIESNIEETSCPFCETALLAQVSTTRRSLKGRGAKMAFALFGTAAIVGACIAPPSPLYGLPPQENTKQEQPQQEAVAEDAGTVVEKAPNPGPVPKYGLPPSP